MAEKKYVYFFGNGKADGNAEMKNLLGGKGANLAEMTNIGLPVPPGFTITTEVCTYFYQHNRSYPPELKTQVEEGMRKIEEIIGRKFGSEEAPLLVSVRSGAPVSMPGMMDTVLNLGLNDKTVWGLAKMANNERFAFDSYRRFIQMFGNVVMGIEASKLEEPLEKMKEEKGVELDTELDAEDLKKLVEILKERVKELAGKDFPQDPWDQLWEAIGAVFGSWNNERAIVYRKINNIPDDLGTAVNIVAMVFGNLGDDSGTGVAFTRNPSTGEKGIFGEYLPNAQGEDVVAGIRTPIPISREEGGDESLEAKFPDVYKELVRIAEILENHFKDMQDMEFTIEKMKLWMLQTRTGKRTARAAVRIAVDMVDEGLIDEKTAIMRIDPSSLDQLLHPMIDPKAPKKVIGVGLPASPGAATGKVVFSAEEAEKLAEKGEKVILVRIETSPEDIKGMNAAQGILTARGGMTSHAAVVARGMGKACVVGCGDITIDYEEEKFTGKDGVVVKKGDWITIDGSTGEVMLGQVPMVEPELGGYFGRLMEMADKYRKLGVRTNADTPHDSEVARKFGAEGIGLCRTEHMFFEGDRIDAVRQMILADNEEDLQNALAKLKEYQKSDFYGILKVMEGLPVTIRLLDPPLHEFLPNTDEEIEELASKIGKSAKELKEKAESLREFNPMLGHRGCRLGITFPEIYDMQVEAIFEAACELKKEGYEVFPEIMIPLVGFKKELQFFKDRIPGIAKRVFEKYGVEVPYKIGTMIELPRAALTADEIGEIAEFFSFGTNDLTQTTLGISRDDAGKFLKKYIEGEIITRDPFMTIDVNGVGQLVKIAAEKGRKVNPQIKLGICGEHGGDPDSIDFFHTVGLNYVSCSPYRVPIARLAAAQAAIRHES